MVSDVPIMAIANLAALQAKPSRHQHRHSVLARGMCVNPWGANGSVPKTKA